MNRKNNGVVAGKTILNQNTGLSNVNKNTYESAFDRGFMGGNNVKGNTNSESINKDLGMKNNQSQNSNFG